MLNGTQILDLLRNKQADVVCLPLGYLADMERNVGIEPTSLVRLC